LLSLIRAEIEYRKPQFALRSFMDKRCDDAVVLTPITTHMGTRLYVDVVSGELRHGYRSAVPDNVRLVAQRGVAQLIRWTGERAVPIQFVEKAPYVGVARGGEPTELQLQEKRIGAFSLRRGENYLTAENDGRVNLTSIECRDREIFRGQPATRALKVAAFTMAYNESWMLPLWLAYYGSQVGNDNLYVLDHGSTDGSTEGISASVLKVPRFDPFDEIQRVEFITRFQQSLLCYYDAVIFSDTDEFLVPRPSLYSGLLDFVDRRCELISTAIGVEVVQIRGVEPKLRLDEPILPQRRYAVFAPEYCKTLIARVPLQWSVGLHACHLPPQIDPGLYLFHLKRIDYEGALQHFRMLRSVEWSEDSKAHGYGSQMRTSEQQFAETFFGVTEATIQAARIATFDFAEEIAVVAQAPPGQLFARGRLAEIPEEFAHALAPLGRGA
jgi:hypothetical protein